MFGKKKEAPAAEQAKEEIKAAVGTVIAEGADMTGVFEGSDPIEINGRVKGTINAESSVLIARSGRLTGDGTIHDMTVSGSVDGDFVCRSVAVFKPSGEMTGHLTTPKLQTEEGSRFRGNLDLIEAGPASAEAAQIEK